MDSHIGISCCNTAQIGWRKYICLLYFVVWYGLGMMLVDIGHTELADCRDSRNLHLLCHQIFDIYSLATYVLPDRHEQPSRHRKVWHKSLYEKAFLVKQGYLLEYCSLEYHKDKCLGSCISYEILGSQHFLDTVPETACLCTACKYIGSCSLLRNCFHSTSSRCTQPTGTTEEEVAFSIGRWWVGAIIARAAAIIACLRRIVSKWLTGCWRNDLAAPELIAAMLAATRNIPFIPSDDRPPRIGAVPPNPLEFHTRIAASRRGLFRRIIHTPFTRQEWVLTTN